MKFNENLKNKKTKKQFKIGSVQSDLDQTL